MYGSTLEKSSATIESSSKLPAAAQHALPLQRMGSGVSVVLDDDPPADAGAEAESPRKLPSSQYKGVVPQPNGRWGAQIYEKHRRVWLGTFDHESDAARAYDIAAHRFRGLNAITNFTPLSETDDAAELDFIGSHSKTEIVDMLRKQTYGDELRQSKKACGTHKRKIHSGNGRVDREQLFEKAVTPSDVGKLNRLVIPKQQAEKHFPLKTGSNLLLSFEDACGKVWRFRYSYWNSSQSYVLTKGWSRFVKEKGLKAGDVVGFLRSTGPEKQLYIDFKPGDKAFSSVQVIRLFGVNISKRRETESSSPLSQYFIKKQCIRQL